MPSIATNQRDGGNAHTPARFVPLAAIAIAVFVAGHTLAGPVGEDVKHGQASFHRDGDHTLIDVGTQKAIINYDSFNLTREESVRFQQLSRSSRVLNRIQGASPTVINGSLTANGQVYFVNPAGVMFGQHATINTAGIYAAAGNIANADFLNNVDRFTNLSGDVVNRGSINAQFVALVGERVRNDGIIFANNGLVTMVAGDEVTLARHNDTVSVSFTRDADAPDDNSDIAAVSNNGTIDAGENGQTTLAAGDMYWLGVKQSETGSVEAGKVAVNAEGGKAELTGKVDAGDSAVVAADEIAFYNLDIGVGDVNLTGNRVTVGNVAGPGAVEVTGTPRDDLMVLDFGYGLALPGGGLSFDAGSQQNPKPLGDALEVRGGSFNTVGITYTDAMPEGFSGSLSFDGYVVEFAGFEPLANSGSAANIIYTLPAGGNPDAVLSDDGTPNDNVSQIDGSTFELTGFTNPTDSLTINLDGDGDSITLNALDAQFDADLTINGGASADAITVNAFTGAGAFTFDGVGASDTLTGPAGGATFIVNAADGGTLAGATFSNIENLVGAAADDIFDIRDGGSIDTIDGGGEATADTLTYASHAAPVTVDLQTNSNSTGIDTNLTNIEAYVGENTDSTLSGMSAGSTFVVNGTNDGTVDGDAFTDFTDLTGGAGDDTFDIRDGGSIDTIDGGGQTTADTLTYASQTGPITVNLESDSATGVGASGLNGIENLVGSGDSGDELIGPNAVNTWTVGAADTGSVAGTDFADFANLTGGSDADTFNINDNVSGTVDGQGGDDTFTVTNLSTTGSLNIAGGADAGGDTLNIVDSTRGGGITYDVDDSAVDDNAGNTVTIASTETISLTAGGGDDSITVTPSNAATFTVDGGGESSADTFIYDTAPLTASPDLQITNGTDGTVAAAGSGTQLDVNYQNMETIDVTGPHLLSPTFDLSTVGPGFQDGAADTIDAGIDGSNDLVIDINSSTFTFTIGAASVDVLEIVGTNDDDTLTLDFDDALFNADFAGSGGFNTLALTGNAGGGLTDVTYRPANVTDGFVVLDGSIVIYTGLAPIQDATTATNLALHLTDAANTATVTNGGNAGSGVFTGVSDTGELQSADVENYEWANKTNVTVNGGDATAGGDSGDNITLDMPNQPDGLTGDLTIDGQEGDDTITVAPHNNGIDPILDGGRDPGDTFILNPDPTDAAIEVVVTDDGGFLDPLDAVNDYSIPSLGAGMTINAGGFASAELRGTNNADTIRLGDDSAGTNVDIDDPVFLTSMTLVGGGGDDAFQFELIPADLSVNAQGDAGDDTFLVARTSGGAADSTVDLTSNIEGTLTIAGGGDATAAGDTLEIGDGATPLVQGEVFADRVENLTPQPINYDGSVERMDIFLTGNTVAGAVQKQIDVHNIAVDDLLIHTDANSTNDLVTADFDTLNDSARVTVNFGGGADALEIDATDGDETLSMRPDGGADLLVRRETGGSTDEQVFVNSNDFTDDRIALDGLAGGDTIELRIPAAVDLDLLEIALGADADTIELHDPVDATSFHVLAPLANLVDFNDTGANGADVVGTNLSLELDTGLANDGGNADAAGLETAVTNLDLRNISSGDVVISNTGALTLTDNGEITGTRGNLGAGTTTITAASPMTVNMDQTFGGDTTLTASDSGAANEDFTLDSATLTVDSGTGRTLTIDAADAIAVINGGQIDANQGGGAHAIALNADIESNAAGDLTQTGSLTTVTADTLTIVSRNGVGTSATVPFRFDVNTLDSDSSGNGGNQFLHADTAANALTSTTVNAGAAGGFVDFATAGSVDQSSGGTITAAGLALRGAGAFTLEAPANDVDKFAADMTGSFSYVNTDALAIDTVNGVAGIVTTTDGTVDTGAGAITVQQPSTATNDFTFTPAGDFIMNADVTAGNLATVNAGGEINGNANTLTASTLDLDAVTGIGGTVDVSNAPADLTDGVATAALRTVAATVAADTSGGNVEIVNQRDSATSITSLTTVGADIVFEQIDSSGNEDTTTAGGPLNIDGPVTSGDGGTNGGNITLRTDGGGLNVNAPANIDTTIGGGGAILLTGGVDLDPAATITLGAGDVNLIGGQLDYVHDEDFTFGAPVTVDVERDILITALFETIGADNDITFIADRDIRVDDLLRTVDTDTDIALTADDDDDGVGGFRVGDPGEVNAAANIDVSEATDLFATGAANDAIVILEDGGGNPQFVAGGSVTLNTDTATNAAAFMSILGDIESAFGGDAIVFGAADSIRLKGTHTATDANGDIQVISPLVMVGDAQFVGNDVTFQNTINDDGSVGTDSDLQVDADGVTAFQDDVGGSIPIDSITTDAPGETRVADGAPITIHTSGSTQTYNNPFILTNDTTLTDTGSGVFFNNTVDGDSNGPWDLTVNTAGTTQFGDDAGDEVGGTDALATLTTDAPGVTNINTDLVRTEGGVIDLLDDVTLGFVGTTVIDSTDNDAVSSGGTITFGGTLDGTTARAQELTLDAGTTGNIDFDAVVGGGTRLGELRIDRAVDVSADAGVTVESLAFDPGDVSGNAVFDAFINTNGASGGNAGNVIVDADGNVTIVGNVSAVGGTNPAGPGGTGGTVDIKGNTVAVNAINSSGGASTSGAAGGNAGTIDLDAEGGPETIAVDGDLTASGGSGSPTGDGADITLGIDGAATDTINLGPVDIAVAATGDTAGNLDFNAESVAGSNAGLTLKAGGASTSGDITFDFGSDADGNDLTGFDDVLVTNANNVTVSDDDDVNIGSFEQIDGSGATTFGGELTTTDAGGVDITTASATFRDNVTVNAGGPFTLNTTGAIDFDAAQDGDAPVVLNGGGSMAVSNGGPLTIANGVGTIDLNGGGSFSQTGAGAVTTGADVSTENDGSVLFSADVTLTNNIEIDTDRGDPTDPVAGTDGTGGSFDTGDITFSGNILATAQENLTLDAGAGDISVTGTVGTFGGGFTATDLTDLTVVRANTTEFLSTVEVDTFTQTDATGGSPSTLLSESVNIHQSTADAVGIEIVNPGALTLGNSADGDDELLTLVNDADALFTVGDAEFLGGANSIVPANASGDAILTVQPNNAGGDMAIGSGAGGVLALSNTDVNAIAEGYEVIFLGRADGSGAITIGNTGLTFHDPLFVRAPETGGSVQLVGELTIDDTAADAAVDAPLGFDAESISLGGQIITNGQNFYLVHGLNQALTGGDPNISAGNLITQIGNPGGDPRDTNASVIVTDATDINTDADVANADAGDVFFEDTIDSETGESNNMTLSAAGDGAGDDGDLNFGAIAGQGAVTGRIGGNRRLGEIEINAAEDVTFGHNDDGAVSALSFDQNAGSGDTTFNGRVAVGGVDMALQTGGFNNLDGGQVEIDIAGDVTFAGAIIARGGPVVAGVGRDGGSVDLAGEDIIVKRIDTRGSAGVTAAGGDAGVITLNADSNDGDDIEIGGDLLATGGVVAGFADGDAAAINLGDTPATEQIILDPQSGGGWLDTAETLTMEGHDVTFDALVDANSADADSESLFVNTFDNASAGTTAGTTTFNGVVGGNERPLRIRTDFSADFATAADANGVTVIDTPTVNVVDELTFNDPVKIAHDAGVTTLDASGAAGTLRFNNLLDSASGETNDLTLNAENTIFDDDYAFGVGGQGVGAGVQDPAPNANDVTDALVGSVDPLQILLTDAAGATTINTTGVNVGAAEFNDAVVIATDDGGASNGGRTTITATDGDTLLAAAPAVETVRFDNTVDSSPADADGNELFVTTTGGGTTIFNARVGVTTPLGRLQTDVAGSPDGVTQLNITTGTPTDTDIETDGTSIEFNDPVELLADTVIVENDPAGTVVFNNTVNGDGNGPWDLIVTTNGAAAGDVTTEFNGVVGGNEPLDLLRVNHLATNPGGDTTLLAANAFADAMEFFDNIVLGADVTLAADAALADATSVDFFGLLDDDGTSPANDLTVEATATQFHDQIGSIAPLGTVQTTDGGGPDTTILGDNADAITNLVSNAEQFLFDDAVVLEDDLTLNSSIAGVGSDTATLGIAFNDTLDSDAPGTPRDLTLNTTAGALTRFGDGTGTDEVGATAPLDVLTLDVGPAGNGTTLIDVDVYADTMVYNDAVAIGDDAADAADDATFDGVELGGTSAPADASTITFNNTVDTFSGDANNNLFLFSTMTNVNGVVGGTGELGTLQTTDGGGDDTNLNTTAVNVQTARFDDPVFIAIGTPATPGTLTITASAEEADAAFEIDDDAVQFNNTVNSEAGELNRLVVNTTAPNLGGVTRFGDGTGADVVGGSERLGRIETNANGAVHVFSSNINTDGTTVIHNDPVVLFKNVIYSELSGDVVFNNTVDADDAANDRELRVRTDVGDAIFAGVVGGGEAPHLIKTDDHVTPAAASGQTLIDTANVTVQSEMTFNESVVIGVNSTLAATDGDGTVRFNNVLDSQASGTPLTNEQNDLTINASTTVFDGNGAMGTGFADAGADAIDAVVGGTNPLGTLLTQPAGAGDASYINTTTMTATVLQFDDPAVAAVDATLFGTAASAGDDVIIFNDTLSSTASEFNDVTLNTAGAGDTLFNGNVGADLDGTATGVGTTDGTELGELITNADGRTLIVADHVQTNDEQRYNDAVELRTDTGVTFREFAGRINFNDTLDADGDAGNENATFFVQGDLNFNGVVGGVNRLGDVLVNDANNLTALFGFTADSVTQGADATDTSGGRGDTQFNGLVDTSGDGGDGGDIVVLTDGEVRFFGGATLDGDAGGDGGTMRLRPDMNNFTGPNTDLLPNDQPEDMLVLRGMFTSLGDGGGDGGMLLLNADETDATRLGRSTNPTVATIRTTSPNGFGGDPAVADHDLLLEAGRVLIGPYEKLTAFGSVTFRNTDTAVDVGGDTTPTILHNDLTILEDLTVNAGPNGEIFYRLRPAGPVLDVNGVLQQDLGVDVILGGLAAYSETPQALPGTSGPPLIFANPGAIFTEPGSLQGFVQRDFSPVLEPLLRLTGNGIALDANSKGPSNANAAEALAAVAPKPDQLRETLETTIVGGFQRQLLADFAGVDLRGLTQAERLSFLAGRQLYKDLPAGPGAAKVTVARALLTENRLSYEPVSNMLDFYQRLFLGRVIDPQTGQPTYISRHIEHRRDIGDAYAGYTEQAETFDADQFVRFVRADERHTDALQSLRGLRTLREKFELLGLTPLENAQAMRSVIDRVTPEGMTVDQVRTAVNRVEPMTDEEIRGQASDLDAESEAPEGEG